MKRLHRYVAIINVIYKFPKKIFKGKAEGYYTGFGGTFFTKEIFVEKIRELISDEDKNAFSLNIPECFEVDSFEQLKNSIKKDVKKSLFDQDQEGFWYTEGGKIYYNEKG